MDSSTWKKKFNDHVTFCATDHLRFLTEVKEPITVSTFLEYHIEKSKILAEKGRSLIYELKHSNQQHNKIDCKSKFMSLNLQENWKGRNKFVEQVIDVSDDNESENKHSESDKKMQHSLENYDTMNENSQILNKCLGANKTINLKCTESEVLQKKLPMDIKTITKIYDDRNVENIHSKVRNDHKLLPNFKEKLLFNDYSLIGNAVEINHHKANNIIKSSFDILSSTIKDDFVYFPHKEVIEDTSEITNVQDLSNGSMKSLLNHDLSLILKNYEMEDNLEDCKYGKNNEINHHKANNIQSFDILSSRIKDDILYFSHEEVIEDTFEITNVQDLSNGSMKSLLDHDLPLILKNYEMEDNLEKGKHNEPNKTDLILNVFPDSRTEADNFLNKTISIEHNYSIKNDDNKKTIIKHRRHYLSPCPEMKLHHEQATRKGQKEPKEPFIRNGKGLAPRTIDKKKYVLEDTSFFDSLATVFIFSYKNF